MRRSISSKYGFQVSKLWPSGSPAMMNTASLSCGGTCLRSQPYHGTGRPARRCVKVTAAARQDLTHGLYNKVGTALIAATLWTGFTFAAPDVHHLEARAEKSISAYQKRVEDAQRRKQMLSQARQNALAKGGSLKAIEAGEMEDPEVVAANQKVEEANAKRQQESERSLQALQQKSADTYSKQSSVKGPGLKGISYTLASSDVPSAFNFSDPPSPLSVPKSRIPSPPVTPSTVMNNSSSSPMPSAIAPSQSRQPEGSSNDQGISNLFEGLFDSVGTESSPEKSSQVPNQQLQGKESRPTATEPPPGPFKATSPAAKTYLVEPTAKTAKAEVQKPAKQVAKKDGKRRGPLPLFLGQLLVLAAYGGVGFLAFQRDEETRKAIALIAGLLQKGYSKVQGLLPSGSKA
ncbi:hypothetical protein ABBQ32_010349 [Trebouxia sp. C0010 RCD-2024]